MEQIFKIFLLKIERILKNQILFFHFHEKNTARKMADKDKSNVFSGEAKIVDVFVRDYQ